MRLLTAICGIAAAVLISRACVAQDLAPLGRVEFVGDIRAPEDLSAIAQVGSFLLIASDEAAGMDRSENFLQVLKQVGINRYAVHRDILLYKGGKDDEVDIEGIAVDGNTVFVVGSHSSLRKRLGPDKKYQTNRSRFLDREIGTQNSRDRLFRLTVDSEGKGSKIEFTNLGDIIKGDPVLKTFSQIPGKENGVDIEGIAVKEKWLYAGFRSPVFRGNYVPVMKFQFHAPRDYELLYVNLGGRGIRDITAVSDGFLIVAGPSGDMEGSFQLYHWDGRDVIPGNDRHARDIGTVKLLGGIPLPKNGKAEGVVVLEELPTSYEVVIVYDGVSGGDPQRFRAAKALHVR
jgi:uncharacterized protein DUF3616